VQSLIFCLQQRDRLHTNLLEEDRVGRVWCIEVVGQRVHRAIWGATTRSSALKVGKGQSCDLCAPQDGLVAMCVVVWLHLCRTGTREHSEVLPLLWKCTALIWPLGEHSKRDTVPHRQCLTWTDSEVQSEDWRCQPHTGPKG
jgi:hypothetical protein